MPASRLGFAGYLNGPPTAELCRLGKGDLLSTEPAYRVIVDS